MMAIFDKIRREKSVRVVSIDQAAQSSEVDAAQWQRVFVIYDFINHKHMNACQKNAKFFILPTGMYLWLCF